MQHDPSPYVIPNGNDFVITRLHERELNNNLVVKCGDGCVVIDLSTGSVTLDNCTLDHGARAFWDAVARLAGRK